VTEKSKNRSLLSKQYRNKVSNKSQYQKKTTSGCREQLSVLTQFTAQSLVRDAGGHMEKAFVPNSVEQ